MAIAVMTTDPAELLAVLYDRVRGGTIGEWVVDQEGDLTLNAPEWTGLAWFQPTLECGALLFTVIGADGSPVVVPEAYCTYHAYMVATLLTHLSEMFEQVALTPQRVRSASF